MLRRLRLAQASPAPSQPLADARRHRMAEDPRHELALEGEGAAGHDLPGWTHGPRRVDLEPGKRLPERRNHPRLDTHAGVAKQSSLGQGPDARASGGEHGAVRVLLA